MHISFKNFTKICITICLLKLIETTSQEEYNSRVAVKDNHNIFLKDISDIKGIASQLEIELNNLQTGLDQQAEIVYGYNHKNPKIHTNNKTEIFSNCSEQMEEFYNNFKSKLTNSTEIIENSLELNNELFLNETRAISEIIESLNKCAATKSENMSPGTHLKFTNILQQLQKQMDRIVSLKKKFNSLNKLEDILKENSDNLSNIIDEILIKLESQDRYFENLSKQLPLLQVASQTLDDHLIHKTQNFNYHQRCTNGNCQHGHHSPRHRHQRP